MIDSTIDIPNDLKEKYQIITIPLNIILNNHVYLDGVDLTREDLVENMKNNIIPKTSQITPDVFKKEFIKILKTGDNIIYLAFSKKLSGTYNSAISILNEVLEMFPDQQIEIIDSKGGAFAVGLIALRLAELEEQGTSFKMLVKEAIKLIEKTNYRFTLTNLDWLARGGRINKAVSFIGDTLNIKPILNVEDGEIKVIKKVRGDKKANKVLLNDVLKGLENFPNQRIGIGYSADKDRAEMLKEEILKKFPNTEIIISQIGNVLTSHLGLGGLGVFWLD